MFHPDVVNGLVEDVMRALAPSDGGRLERRRIQRDLADVERKLPHYAAAIAKHGPLESVITELKLREARRTDLRRHLEGSTRRLRSVDRRRFGVVWRAAGDTTAPALLPPGPLDRQEEAPSVRCRAAPPRRSASGVDSPRDDPVRTQLPAARAEAVMDRRAFLAALGLLGAPTVKWAWRRPRAGRAAAKEIGTR